MAYWQKDLPICRRAYQEALAISRELGDRPAEAEGLYNLSFVRAYQGDIAGAVAGIQQSREMFEDLGIGRGVADTLWFFGDRRPTRGRHGHGPGPG